MMQARDPSSDFTVWFAPGGGMESDENPETCLRREIEEETGIVLTDIGPLIWRRHHTFVWNGQILSQDEDFYVVYIDEFEPDFTTNPSEAELMSFQRFKWWSPAEISRSRDIFAPRLLAKHLQNLIELGTPDKPVDVGV